MNHNYTHDTQYAGLVTLAAWLQRKGIWQTVADNVVIRQKTVKHRPIDKLLDTFIHILTGEHRMVTMNTGLRCDEGLQQAFGRDTCVEQSLASTTLDRCDEETVAQMYAVCKALLHKHSSSYRHDYKRKWQVLDVDMTGLLAGRQAEGSEKGYFANRRGARGRQLGRVLASNYGEVVYEQLYSGRAHLESKLEELIIAADDVLALNDVQRKRTLLRIDGAGGSDRFINWVLEKGFGILTKVHSWKRSRNLATSVKKWHVDPRDDGREVGWVTAPHPYIRATRQLAVRKRNKKGNWLYSVLVTSLSPQSLCWLAQQPTRRQLPPTDRTMWAFLHSYDRRGGGVETSIRESKQALGLNKRNKRRFLSQEMLVLLTQLAQNTLIWFRQAMTVIDPKWRFYGLLRLIRDFLKMRGLLDVDSSGHVRCITFKPRTSKAVHWKETSQVLIPSNELSFCLYET
jgi:hypothetical protein